MAKSADVDILVVGAGVLGVTLVYWLSNLYDCTLALADIEEAAGMHTSSRNTGVIHRPFYLDPHKKRVFAQTSRISHTMWERLAKDAGLPWMPIGTFNIALEQSEVRTLEQYRAWGMENGMEEKELELLDGRGVSALEPEVRCRAALVSKTDVSVDFGVFTRHLSRYLAGRGVRFLGGQRVVSVAKEGDGLRVDADTSSGRASTHCRFLINAAGGGAIGMAHACGLAKDYTSLNFRGEYWVVDEPFASKVTSNIYRPPRFPKFPFLDPHFVVRADGSRQIGPNAVMVPGPYVYSGVGLRESGAFLERPVEPKLRLMTNPDFVSLVAGEWRSSLSKRSMCGRVKNFVPGLDITMLNRRAVFGVRTSVINASGFVPEAILLKGDSSAHIINYNSPGATGAPSFSALVVASLRDDGSLDGFRRRDASPVLSGWDFGVASAASVGRIGSGQRL
jgi:L-2-hydroxyglutarate oxidase